MTLIELFAPKGALTEESRQQVGERLVTELMSAPQAPPEVIERGRSLTWVMVHEPSFWAVGTHAVAQGEAPRFLVRVTVPAGHMNAGMRAEIIKRVTRVLAELDPAGDRLYQRPDAWIHIVELPDGNAGAFGRVVKLDALMKLVMTGALPAEVTTGPTTSTVVDPICGMSVALGDKALTLTREGTVYGFCSEACRELFAARNGPPAP